MNRLRDDAGDDPASDTGVELLRATPPTPCMPELKRRVWLALQHDRRATLTGAHMSPVKVLALVFSIVLFAGAAGAVITGRWIVPALERSTSPSLVPAASPRPDRARAARPVVKTAEVATAARPAAVSARVKTKSPAIAPRAAASSAQERTEVLDALIALRRDHDPRRAGALLERYLSGHPQGALREEALVLATEAADARGEPAQAQRLARVYQADYPNGRFREFARSHTESSVARSAVPTFNLDGAPGVPPPAQH